MNEKQLFSYWRKYIDIPIYRVVRTKDLVEIKTKGITPKEDPYKEIRKEIKQLLQYLEKNDPFGKIVFLDWGRKVSGVFALKVTLWDLSVARVDFAPDKKSVDYYLKFRGGAATKNLREIIDLIKTNNLTVSLREEKIINKIKKFVLERDSEMTFVSLKGSSKLFERALLQRRRKTKPSKRIKLKLRKLISSPFGSFEHFKKFASKHDLREDDYYLKNKMFFLRVKEKIPASEIEVMK